MDSRAVFFTGHRPKGLYGDRNAQVAILKALIIGIWNQGFSRFITGGAVGLDQMAAEIVADLRDTLYKDMVLVIARPFPSQASMWPAHVQQAFQLLCSRANEVYDVSPDPYTAYKMQIRNEWMVNNAEIGIAMWNGASGGTANCVRYAQKKGKPILVVHPQTITLTRINC
jgi:uncharacterized phage-like protein YoqJ